MKKINHNGNRHNRLVLIKEVAGKSRHRYYLCQCDCGKKKEIRLDSILNHRVKSCGCLAKEQSIKRLTTHGLSKHPLHQIWKGMKERCFNIDGKTSKYWGKRGITVCDEWKSDFMMFYIWCRANGWRKGLEIDRIDNNGNYEPSNCEFVTHRRNNLNKKGLRSDNTTGYVGVYRNRRCNTFTSRIRIKGKDFYIGSAKTITDAVDLRNFFIVLNNLQNDYHIQEAKHA